MRTPGRLRASRSGPVRITKPDGTRELKLPKRPRELIELADEDAARRGGEMEKRRAE
jgi:hypothetical protein